MGFQSDHLRTDVRRKQQGEVHGHGELYVCNHVHDHSREAQIHDHVIHTCAKVDGSLYVHGQHKFLSLRSVAP